MLSCFIETFGIRAKAFNHNYGPSMTKNEAKYDRHHIAPLNYFSQG